MSEPDSMRVDEDGEIDYVIKSNKGKIHDKNKPLKIESVGNEPVHIIDLSKKKTVNPSVANLKRLEALKEQKRDYKYKKSLIHTALSNIDNKSSNKTIFHEDRGLEISTKSNNQNGNNRFDLFDGNVSDEDYQGNFDVREEFQNEEGQKLLQLEYRYKNDKRFTLDSRFLDEQEKISKEKDGNNKMTMEEEEITLEEEKKKEYEILEQVLGKKINRKPAFSEMDSQRKTMIRFDPTDPEHSKYVMPKMEKKEKRRKKVENDIFNEKKQEEKDKPVVSKEVFYKVSDDLKETFHEKNEFSLRSMFHQTEGTDEEKELPEATEILGTNFAPEKNPFRYDSSDEEEEIPSHDTIPTETPQRITNRAAPGDPLFFRKDDYRLQAGFDFVKKMAVKEVEEEFAEMRRKTMKIVKAKIRNIQKKNQPFKKKLGGKKGKKAIRLKKAMKK